MRITLFMFAVASLWSSLASATESATILSAMATSSARQSTPVSCLLQTDCRGSWSPGSADSGANEGVYVQFEMSVGVDAVELVLNDKSVNAPYTLSINGAPLTDFASPKAVEGQGVAAYAVRYPIAGSQVKSLFFKLGVRKGGWKQFSLYSIRFYRGNEAVKLTPPIFMPATVTATSQLEPKVAYQAANLFDSRYDFAWSTDGKTTKGPGESLEIKFTNPQDLAGMIVWNGYQRSNTHFKANGRVAQLTLASEQGKQKISLADKLGAQRITLPQGLKGVSSLRLTIDTINPGSKYKDVLLSELRFIDTQGRVVLPAVVGLLPAPNKQTGELVDRSLSSVVCSSSLIYGDFQRSFRLRKDGSFVIYARAYDEEGGTDQVLEGNWNQAGKKVRIFGKRYAETVLQSDYSQTTTHVPASIFQSYLRIVRFQELTPQEQQQLAELIWSRIVGKSTGVINGDVKIFGTEGVLAQGENKVALMKNFVAALNKLNPWTVHSPILADAMLPSDETGACDSYL